MDGLFHGSKPYYWNGWFGDLGVFKFSPPICWFNTQLTNPTQPKQPHQPTWFRTSRESSGVDATGGNGLERNVGWQRSAGSLGVKQTAILYVVKL